MRAELGAGEYDESLDLADAETHVKVLHTVAVDLRQNACHVLSTIFSASDRTV